MNWFIAMLSQLLEPDDRECICGDVEELRLSVPAAALNIVGLVMRRQLAEWSHFGPWAALLGVAGVTGFFVSGSLAAVETEIFVQTRTYIHYGVAYQPGGVSTAQEVTYAATAFLGLLLCSWACGFVLSSLAGRAFWITSFLFYCNVRDSSAIRMALDGNIVLKHGLWFTMLFRLLPLGPIVLAFLLALAFGRRVGMTGKLQWNSSLVIANIGLASVPLLVWMQSWFAAGFAQLSGQTYLPKPFVYRMLPWVACFWPVLLIPFLQWRRHESRQRAA